MWKLEPVYPEVNTGTYTVKNLNSGLFIAEENGNALQNGEYIWSFTKLDNGNYNIQDTNGKYLTVEGGAADDGANMSTSDYTGDKSQEFIMYCNDDGTYTILSAVSDGKSCADVYGISLDAGANICQWNYWGGNGQKFILEPAYVEPPIEYIKGDIDDDKVVDSIDLALLRDGVVNGLTDEREKLAGDMNEDGAIDADDLVQLRDFIMGK